MNLVGFRSFLRVVSFCLLPKLVNFLSLNEFSSSRE